MKWVFRMTCRAFPALWSVALATVASAQTFTEFPLPEDPPIGIAAGADGALWFTVAGGNEIGRITTTGALTAVEIPTLNGLAGLIAAGPDGALWFTERSGNKVGRITIAGVIKEFTIPTAGSAPMGITAGPDGALWFTEIDGNKIGRVTTAGVLIEFAIPTSGSQPIGIAAGPDGALWFTEFAGNKIGRITPSGVLTEFAIPTSGSQPLKVAPGPDGALWFTESARNQIGRITTGGAVTEFAIPTDSSEPTGIVAGVDGALWFTEFRGNKIGRITIAGVVTEFTIPSPNSQPVAITTGPDGALWFTEQSGHIGRIGVAAMLSRVTVPVAASIHGASSTFFHSDVRVFNPSATAAVIVTANYRCFASPPCGDSPQTFTLAPREMRVFDDMVAATFHAAESGGAIEFSSIGSLVVSSRLYTPSRPSPTYGMGVPGLLEAQAPTTAVLTSLSHSADPSRGFRSNVGAHNPNDVAQTIAFTVYDGNGAQLGVATARAPARTPVQISNLFSVIGLARDVSQAYCVVKGDQSLPLLAYAAVIDNQSEDLAFIPGQANAPLSSGRVTIPVAASIHGTGGTFFHTDAAILNTSASASAQIAVRYRCFSGSCGNAGSQSFLLAPRDMRAFDDIIASLFLAPESGGAIEIDSDQPIVVHSRLYTPSRPAPTSGMGVPGMPESEALVTSIMTSLSHSSAPSAGFRSNVGAYNANDVSQTITFTLHDPTGAELGEVSADAPARTSVQISNVFAAAGITGSVPDAYCVVRGDRSLPLLAYAAVIDNQSQDLAFIRGESDLP